MTDLVRINRERILAGEGSPKVLVGGINRDCCPNFHTLPMIEMGASVVGIAIEPEAQTKPRPEWLYCSPMEPIGAAMRRLPPKWKPDFYWDAQVEHGHYFPPGLSDIPIPTVASFNHCAFGQALRHLDGLFDCLIAPSSQMAHWGDVTLPWGASWGAMDRRVEMVGVRRGAERDVDVACTIGTSGLGQESVRWRVLAELKAIQVRRPDWRIEIAHGLSQAEYFQLLARSKVALNVGYWGSQMTYRPLEIIALEAALVHVDETGYGSTHKLAEDFDHKWFVSAEPWCLEGGIEYALLRTPEERARIRREVHERFSYAHQYERLFEVAGRAKIGERFKPKEWARRAFAVNHLTGYPIEASVHAWALEPHDRQSLVRPPRHIGSVCLWQPKENEARWRFQTALARREEPDDAIYARAYEEDLHGAIVH